MDFKFKNINLSLMDKKKRIGIEFSRFLKFFVLTNIHLYFLNLQNIYMNQVSYMKHQKSY